MMQYIFKPDGEHEISDCKFVLAEEHRKVTVITLRCPICGREDFCWMDQENSEHEYYLPVKDDPEIDVDPCFYDQTHIYTNCLVTVLKCKDCGLVSTSWDMTLATEELEDLL